MRTLFVIITLILLIFAIGCDTELGHHEEHDHDGDGIQDHSPEEHNEDMYGHIETEKNNLT